MHRLTVHFTRRLSFALLAGAVLWMAGCSKGPKTSVTGKVLIDGKSPAMGIVVFIGPDDKEISTGIDKEGNYTIPNPKKGKNKILVKGAGEAGPGGDVMAPPVGEIKPPKDAPEQKDGPSGGLKANTSRPPHKDYGDAKTTNLEVEVTGEKDQSFDIDLKSGGTKAK